MKKVLQATFMMTKVYAGKERLPKIRMFEMLKGFYERSRAGSCFVRVALVSSTAVDGRERLLVRFHVCFLGEQTGCSREITMFLALSH